MKKTEKSTIKIEKLNSKKKKRAKKESCGGEDDEDGKIKEQLSSCLVTKIPNVSWDNFTGLENAINLERSNQFTYSIAIIFIRKISTFEKNITLWTIWC